MNLHGWNLIDEARAVLWREYEFAKGAFATTLVFRGADGLVVISPGKGLQAADYDALKAFGEVRALVANNTSHHLGQAAWRAHFPQAESYASPQALPILAQKNPSIPFRPIAELALPADTRAHALDGFKGGDLFFTMPAQRGTLWFTGDLLTNIQQTPGPPLKWFFSLSDSAPGYRLFRLFVWRFVADKNVVREQVTKLLADQPPALIVPAHGPALTIGDVAAMTKEQLAKL